VSRNEQDRLRDISDAITAIRDHLAWTDNEPRGEDAALLHDALLFQFVVIGEAVKNLAPETRGSEPDIPWADIAGLRDLIAHEYFCRRPAQAPEHSYAAGAGFEQFALTAYRITEMREVQ
jgi:uncharacterized protein with HEPN domain